MTYSILFIVAISNGNPLTSIEHVNAQQNATDNLEQDSSPIPTMIENVRDSVVGIILPETLEENPGPNYEYDGSGFVYVEDDIVYIITNEHVISNNENETVDVHFIDNGDLFEANVTGADFVADIAVLEVNLGANQTTSSSPIEPLTLANSSDIRQGQQVFAIGSPFPTDASIPNLVTSGIISKPSYTYEDEEGGIIGAIVSDVATIGGNSGGPLLNVEGEVIGMIAAGDDEDGEINCCSYAIPSNTLKQIVPALIGKGEYSQPSIGFTPQTIAMDESTIPAEQKGIAIHSIERGGPADEAGLEGSTINQFGESQIGDIITAVDGKPIATAEEFEAYIVQNKVVGENVDLTLYRNGTINNTTIKLE